MTKLSANATTAATALALALTLGGCQALGFGGAQMASTTMREAPAVDLGAEVLAEGRAALEAGRTTDAIDAFMLAKAYPVHAPAAYNGLAVAYSRLGRTDLTERFFLTAVGLAPDEAKYRTNLALFYSKNAQPRIAEPALVVAPVQATAVALAAVSSPDAPTLAVAAQVERRPVVRALKAGVTVQSPGPALQRISKGEVSIRTAPLAGTPSAVAVTGRGGHRAVIEVGGARSAPAVRVGAAAYPVRIPLQN